MRDPMRPVAIGAIATGIAEYARRDGGIVGAGHGITLRNQPTTFRAWASPGAGGAELSVLGIR